MQTTRVSINLELDVQDDSITGVASDGNGGSREFLGWLGLFAAIDALLDPGHDSREEPCPMSVTDPAAIVLDIDRLRELSSGSVVAPTDPSWDEARQAFNVAVDQRPAAVAIPADAADVAAVVAFARDAGLCVVPQTTGHNAVPLGSLEGTLLVKTSEMRSVEIDREKRVARVGGGAVWEDVVPRASEMGLAALHGSSPDVGIVGYSLGGGLGWYARAHGLQSNQVLAVELVTADGRLVRASADEEPELFWALRGGGGNFGVVTAIEFRLFELSELYAGAFFFPWERTAEVLGAWRELLPSLPDEITSLGRVLQVPPLPDVPEPMRGRGFVLVEAVSIGDREEAERLLKPLRDLGPEMDTFAVLPPAGIAELHMDPRSPMPAASGHMLLEELSPEGLDRLVALIGPDSASPLVSVEVRHTGGALTRGGEAPGALGTLSGSLALYAVGVPFDEAAASAIATRVSELHKALEPFAAGHYPNFVERSFELESAYDADAWRRLQAAKAKYDPSGLFRANHPITTAA